MADNQQNRGRNRSSNQEWSNDNDRNQGRNWSERGYSNYESGEGQDFGSSYGSRYGQQQNEYNSEGDNWRDANSNRNSGSRYSQQYNSGNSPYEDGNYGYGGREYGSNYGSGNYQGNDSYYRSGSSESNQRPSYGGSRNLYDRDYEGYNRQGSRGSNVGGANYGSNYEQRNRRNYDDSRSWGYSGSNYGGNFYQDRFNDRRDYGRGDANERSWWDRTKDEVSSWFGDDEAERRRQRDSQQSYKGKGPKNYSRSDDRIKEDINDRLSDDPWVDASEIDVTVTNGEVTLTGTVNARTDKRRAEDIAEAVSGVKNVENRIRVGQTQTAQVGTGTSIGSGSGAGNSGFGSGTSGTSPAAATSEKNKAKSGYITG